jgi:hypothetical protein
MSTAAAEPTPPATPATPATPALPDIQQLQDALYEIVAAGIDPQESGVPIAKIEAFLHEHARRPMSRDAFIAFYEAQKLPLPTATSPWADGAGSEIRIVPLPPVREPELRPLSLDQVREANEDDTNPHMVLIDDDDVKEITPTPRPRAMVFALWGGLAFVTAGFAATVWWGHGMLQSMRGELQAAQVRGVENERVIQQLEDRAQQIEGRTADIQSSVSASGQMIQQVDQKSDLLIDWINDPKNSPRRRK